MAIKSSFRFRNRKPAIFSRKKKPAIFSEPPTPPPIDPTAFALIAKAPIFNPNDDEQVLFAEYRADAIARRIEQGRERNDPHEEHFEMVAEAMSYGWMLVRVKKWTLENLLNFEARLLGR